MVSYIYFYTVVFGLSAAAIGIIMLTYTFINIPYGALSGLITPNTPQQVWLDEKLIETNCISEFIAEETYQVMVKLPLVKVTNSDK